MNRWTYSIVLLSVGLAAQIAHAAPVSYDFFGYVSRRHTPESPWLPIEFQEGAAIQGNLTFDPARQGDRDEDEDPFIAPVVALQLRSSAGGLLALASDSILRVERNPEIMTFTTSVASSGVAASADAGFTWSSPTGEQLPQDIGTVDLEALQPNSWELTLSAHDPACNPSCESFDVADVHIILLVRCCAFEINFDFFFPPTGWIDSGGAWEWQPFGKFMTNTANTEFTSTIYGGKELKRSYEVRADMDSDWLGAGNTFGLLFNYRDRGNFYELRMNALGTVTLNKAVNGTRTMLQTGRYGLPTRFGHLHVLVIRSGSDIIALVEEETLRAQDATHTGGRAGVFASWNKMRFDEFAIKQSPFWTVHTSRFENSNDWVPAAGGWVAEGGVYRNTSNQQAAISLARAPIRARQYAIHADVNLQWSAPGNRAGLVYDYVDARNYRAVLMQASRLSNGSIEVFEVRDGVRTSLGSTPAPGFSGGQWVHLGVERIGSATHVTATAECRDQRRGINCEHAPPVDLVQAELTGSRRAGLLASWNHVRFDDVVVATEN